MKKIVSLSLVLLFASAAAYVFIASGNRGTEDVSEQVFVPVQRKDIGQSIIATGIIKPKVGAEVKIGAQVSGVVKNLFVKTGSKVKKNDLLALIDPRPYQSQKDKMLALRDIASTERKYAEAEYRRQKALFDQGAISLQQFETAAQRFDLAAARLHQAEAEHEYADLQLGYTRLFSPMDGVVASISTQEGETVAAGFLSPTFVTIVDMEQLELWMYIDETDIGRIRKGQEVSFTVDTYPGEPFEGRVETVYPKAEIQNNVVTYIAVVTIEHREGKILRPEMTATARTFTRVKKNVLAVPKNAVQIEGDKMVVTVLTAGGPEKRFITVGIADAKHYEAVSGVSEKEKVRVP